MQNKNWAQNNTGAKPYSRPNTTASTEAKIPVPPVKSEHMTGSVPNLVDSAVEKNSSLNIGALLTFTCVCSRQLVSCCTSDITKLSAVTVASITITVWITGCAAQNKYGYYL
jgi:hypothetical protein